jgi:hypothetical protein
MAEGAVSQYLLDNAAPQAAERFSDQAILYDPITVRHLGARGVGDGWRCLEGDDLSAPRPPRWADRLALRAG